MVNSNKYYGHSIMKMQATNSSQLNQINKCLRMAQQEENMDHLFNISTNASTEYGSYDFTLKQTHDHQVFFHRMT